MYKLLSFLKFKTFRLINLIYTQIRVYGNSVVHSKYRCYGVPCIFVDKKSGSRMVWGDNFSINSGRFGNAIGFENRCRFSASSGGNIIIGENVGISQATIIASRADVCIGKNTKIGGGVKIYTTDFHSLNFILRRDWNVDKCHVNASSVIIGEDCFIGAGSYILKGVRIGNCSIIGAGSVVTKNVPNGEIWAGNPAKFIKKIELDSVK